MASMKTLRMLKTRENPLIGSILSSFGSSGLVVKTNPTCKRFDAIDSRQEAMSSGPAAYRPVSPIEAASGRQARRNASDGSG